MFSPVSRFTAWLKKAGLSEKEHQLSGMEFCLERETTQNPRYGVHGGIIADEMGLGKTIIMLGCIVSNFVGREGRFNTLVVLPPALLPQWCKIIELFMGHKPLVFHGRKVNTITTAQLAAAPIVVTTYGMIAADRKAGISPLWSMKWNRLIADEAHHLRNMKTSGFRGAMKINANIKWMVTGTPIQNSKTDLFALCAIVGLKKAFYLDPCAIREIISYHLLRRTKKNVGISLPPLDIEVIRVPWASDAEKSLAEQIHANSSFSNVSIANVDETIAVLTRNQLPMLTRARQCCISPQLIKTAVRKMQKKGQLLNIPDLQQVTTCSKLTAITNHLISRKCNRRRKIVFSHYRGEIDALKVLLAKAGITSLSVDGRTSKSQRTFSLENMVTCRVFSLVCKKWNSERDHVFHIVDQFLGPQVLIVQIQSLCEGLNLQYYQEVIFTSPHWNPAIEDQAIARSHRIGQNERVNVFRFVMQNFNESKIPVGDVHAQITIDGYCQIVQDKKRELLSILD